MPKRHDSGRSIHLSECFFCGHLAADGGGRPREVPMTKFAINRRTALMGIGVAATASMIRPLWAQTVAPITIVINQSPWFESFRKTVELYESETGNTVELDVNPFAGSLEKQRNSVRAAQGQYD